MLQGDGGEDEGCEGEAVGSDLLGRLELGAKERDVELTESTRRRRRSAGVEGPVPRLATSMGVGGSGCWLSGLAGITGRPAPVDATVGATRVSSYLFFRW